MQHLEVSWAVRRFFKSLGFKGLIVFFRLRLGLVEISFITPTNSFELR